MDILKDVKQYVSEQFEAKTNTNLFFHNLSHTQEVVEACQLIAKESGISESDMKILEIAAWFHDLGYLDSDRDHEQRSAEMAENYLASKEVPQNDIERILNCIVATKVPQSPKEEVEKILCDADLYHFSLPDFLERSLQLNKERNKLRKEKTRKLEYFEITYNFLMGHTYKTDYGKNVLQPQKEENVKILAENISEGKKKKNDNKKKTKKSNKKEIKSPFRGVESMFRLTANNQISLSSMADNKANILITVNSIIISLIISLLFSKVSEFPRIIIPTLLLLTTSLITIIYSILATRPKISTGRFTQDDIKNRKVNLLFFGNFYNMSLEDYDNAVKEIMLDYDGLYSTLIKDQYSLGIVLARKYKLIRSAYNFFMYGIIITVFAFLFAMGPYLF